MNKPAFEVDDEYIYYSEEGEKLKLLYSLNDFLENDSSKLILMNEWKDIFRKNIEEPVLELLKTSKKNQENHGTPIFKKDKGGEFEREVMLELFHFIKPTYNLDIFYNNPQLAKFNTNTM